MEQNPSWGAQMVKIAHLLRNPKVHYRVHKIPPHDYPVSDKCSPPISRIISLKFCHLHLDLATCSFPSGFSIITLDAFPISPIHATCTSHGI